MDPHPHKGKQFFCTDGRRWRFFCQGQKIAQHNTCSCLVMYVWTQKTHRWFMLLYHETSRALPFHFPLPPRLSWHSCGERRNDACPSETWWIVMNTACVFIWGKARGTEGRVCGKGGGGREGGGRGCGGGADWERKLGFSCGTDAARVAVGSTAVADKRCF